MGEDERGEGRGGEPDKGGEEGRGKTLTFLILHDKDLEKVPRESPSRRNPGPPPGGRLLVPAPC